MTGNYACHLQGGRERAADAVAHQVAILPDSQASSIRAAVDAGPPQVLALVKESRTPLFASDMFAWHPQADAATLTDIKSVQTFACVREAALLRRGDDHG